MEPWFQMVATIVCAVVASDYLYKPYEKMGGNGSAKKVMSEVNKLPIHKSTYTQKNQ